MPGLDPGIHGAPQPPAVRRGVDARIKSGHDGLLEEGMTII
jgi:hypothetical protein